MGIVLKLGQAEVKTGRRREKRLKEDYEKKGYQVLNAKNFNTGVDLIIIDSDGKIVHVIESTNYAGGSYLHKRRARRYARSLGAFPYAKKTLVVSFDENVGDDARKILKKARVNVEVVGYQE